MNNPKKYLPLNTGDFLSKEEKNQKANVFETAEK